jgi:hypothetical protein
MDDKIIIYYMMLHKKLHIKIKKNIESVINKIPKNETLKIKKNYL